VLKSALILLEEEEFVHLIREEVQGELLAFLEQAMD
jgi:hypothetical protein